MRNRVFPVFYTTQTGDNMPAHAKNERVILLYSGKSFATKDDDGTLRFYEGSPPEDWPTDLPIAAGGLDADRSQH